MTHSESYSLNGRMWSMTAQRTVKKTSRKRKPTVCYAFKCHVELSQKSTRQGSRFCNYHWRMVPSFFREDLGATYKISPDDFDINLFKVMMAICLDEQMPLIEWDIPDAAYESWNADERCRVYDRISTKIEPKMPKKK